MNRNKKKKFKAISLYQSGMTVPRIFEHVGTSESTIYRWTRYLLNQKRETRTLSKMNPQLSKEWNKIKNGCLTPHDVAVFSNKKIWWRCSKGHEWKAAVANRAGKNPTGCPYCASQLVCEDNCLAVINPGLAKEWHLTRNGKLSPQNVLPGSPKKVWWQCKKGHEWQAPIYSRNCGRGCPCCVNRKTCKDNCLSTTHPELTKEWHPNKNGTLRPSDIVPSSHRVWWLGDCGHEWISRVSHRTDGVGCPYCVGKKVNKENCLATLNPELAKEWHPIKNHGLTAQNVTLNSGKKVWWKCKKEHEWEASIGNRNKGQGCPHCREYVHEKLCRSIFEQLFNKKFPKTRAALKCLLELDGYCEKLKLAFEYNGEQHYIRVKHWHSC